MRHRSRRRGRVWKLPDPWTQRTRPPILAKPQNGFAQAPTRLINISLSEDLCAQGESGELTDHELMEIAGHANLTTTQRYLNTRIERLKQGVLRAAAKRST
jgi:hypothetical protein